MYAILTLRKHLTNFLPSDLTFTVMALKNITMRMLCFEISHLDHDHQNLFLPHISEWDNNNLLYIYAVRDCPSLRPARHLNQCKCTGFKYEAWLIKHNKREVMFVVI